VIDWVLTNVEKNLYILLRQQRWNFFSLLVLFISTLNKKVADLQEILSNFGVLWYDSPKKSAENKSIKRIENVEVQCIKLWPQSSD